MHDLTPHALVLPFERGLLDFPDRAFLMRAQPSDAFGADWRQVLTCEQSFRPAFDALAAAGFNAVPRLEGTFPAGLLLLTKHKAENRANLARAWGLLEPGGVLVACGANAIGAASFEREVGKEMGLAGTLSKHQARTFWLSRTGGEPPPVLAQWLAAARPRPVGDSGLLARAGCFSPDHVDTGSKVLVECLPENVAGRVADLGAGWGYLGAEILGRFAAVSELDNYEAEALALDDARSNLDRLPHGAHRNYHWLDVAGGMPEVQPYDWIVSNPPFHEGAKADPAIGRAFIAAAWKAIRRRGKFVMVANQHLPYEAELRKRFRDVQLLTVREGFKVYLASNRHDVVR
ncbi:class I SAM-dependent methyltransferase [Magnetospirillum aberrantis]|nr:methyltransferase [Magnetospirillum aberrantis]